MIFAFDRGKSQLANGSEGTAPATTQQQALLGRTQDTTLHPGIIHRHI
jgi:methenyltetrahydromethanopterin cyclohydrolase